MYILRVHRFPKKKLNKVIYEYYRISSRYLKPFSNISARNSCDRVSTILVPGSEFNKADKTIDFQHAFSAGMEKIETYRINKKEQDIHKTVQELRKLEIGKHIIRDIVIHHKQLCKDLGFDDIALNILLEYISS